VARLWAKPSGYSGDYLTIELLCQNQQSWAAVEDVFLNHLLRCEMADQHRAKVKEQAKLVSSVISRPNAKLINAGCGPCFDIRLALAQASTGEAEIVLIDLDANALAFAEEKLSSLPHNGVKFTFVRGDVFTALRHLSAKPSEAGTFDAVLFGGIFDYLPDRVISLLLRAARKLLKKSGEVLFSQVSTANPNRTLTKHIYFGYAKIQVSAGTQLPFFVNRIASLLWRG
jgi:ubiquinone/menaquinone biosynthesis C-methylase UbiE